MPSQPATRSTYTTSAGTTRAGTTRTGTTRSTDTTRTGTTRTGTTRTGTSGSDTTGSDTPRGGRGARSRRASRHAGAPLALAGGQGTGAPRRPLAAGRHGDGLGASGPRPADHEGGGGDGRPLPLDAGIGFRLSRLARAWRAQWTGELAALDLTPPQAAVLRAVAADPGCSVRGLARILGADPMHAKRCADDLEARGLLHSGHRATDRRSRTLGLTAGGTVLAARVDRLVRAREDHLAGALGAADLARLDAILGVLESTIGAGATASAGNGRDGSAGIPGDHATPPAGHEPAPERRLGARRGQAGARR